MQFMNVTENGGIFLSNHDVMPFALNSGEVPSSDFLDVNQDMLLQIEEMWRNCYYTDKTGDIEGVTAKSQVEFMSQRIFRADVVQMHFIDTVMSLNSVGNDMVVYLKSDKAARIRESLAAKNPRRSLR
jgi:hypothetical protein